MNHCKKLVNIQIYFIDTNINNALSCIFLISIIDLHYEELFFL